MERFNRYLRESFYNPLVTGLQVDMALDVEKANVEVLKGLRDIANVREDKDTGARPVDRSRHYHRAMLPFEPAMASIRLRPG